MSFQRTVNAHVRTQVINIIHGVQMIIGSVLTVNASDLKDGKHERSESVKTPYFSVIVPAHMIRSA